MLAVPLVALCLAASPQRYLLTVGDVPLAELRVEVRGDTYEYLTTRLLDDAPGERRRTFTLEGGRVGGLVPEVLALGRRPAAGCVAVLDESTGAPERLCIDGGEGAEVSGTLDGRPFTATYDAHGALETLSLGPARWTRGGATKALVAAGANPFVDGFAVEGASGQLTLQPAVQGARRLTSAPRGVGDASSVGRLRCLLAARRYVEAHPGAALVLGLVLEGDRLWPHAWVREGGQHVDPSVLPDDGALRRRQYLALPRGRAGRVYLELLGGSRRARLSGR